ncbi:hypothetical protein M8C21_023246 [Ambrosia artemisiifolia]|uniref:Uncharacterized protein n=1 Tax=Ambrosia artemisiifolia TaxID=4212 RepID=A0AAD5GCI6_AMBAR|nr:hypothetical protein M8C21_023246 [Ambrosia artemisiifolia]
MITAASLLLYNFYIYHISPPGYELHGRAYSYMKLFGCLL